MSILMGFGVLALFSILAFWRFNALMFILVGGVSIFLGLYWYDAFDNNLGLAIGILLVAYALVCLGFAFRCIFWRDRLREEE